MATAKTRSTRRKPARNADREAMKALAALVATPERPASKPKPKPKPKPKARAVRVTPKPKAKPKARATQTAVPYKIIWNERNGEQGRTTRTTRKLALELGRVLIAEGCTDVRFKRADDYGRNRWKPVPKR